MLLVKEREVFSIEKKIERKLYTRKWFFKIFHTNRFFLFRNFTCWFCIRTTVFATFRGIFRRARDGIPGIRKCVGGLYIRRRRGRESHVERPRRRSRFSCLATGCRMLSVYEASREMERERESSIYFRLPVPSRSGMIYAERVPRLRAAGEFSLSAPHPAVSPGWRSVSLPSLLPPGAFLRREGRDASFSDDMQLPAIVLFFFLFFSSPVLCRTFPREAG